MKKIMFITFLAVVLAACAPAATPAPIKTSIPTFTFTPVPPTTTPTLEFTPVPATPFPTLPPIGMTPDPTQVERWEEYQMELAKVLLYGYGPDAYKNSLCEWDILGRSGQEVYVWAYCGFLEGGGRDVPAIIHLNANGSVQKVEAPRFGEAFSVDVQKMFPADVREKIVLYYSPPSPYMGRPEVLRLHLLDRLKHLLDEPPLIILSAMP